MVTANIVRDEDGKIFGFSVNGHTDYDKYGKDIVCSAVSILFQAAILGLEEYLNIDLDVQIAHGTIECRIPEIKDDEIRFGADAILETMILGLKGIEQEYPGYLRILE
jgi:uncharacterized protein YsxB (DUF464 family)